MIKIDQIDVGGFDSNFSYLATTDGGEAFLVDPCGDAEKIRRAWEEAGCPKPVYRLVTHAHRDHISALDEVKTFFDAPVCVSSASGLPSDRGLSDGEKLPFGNGFIECIATPGHTDDSMCYRLSDDSGIFTGDTLFVDYIGFCRPEIMFESLKKLKRLPDSLVVYSGHNYGKTPTDTLGNQKKSNPFFRPDTLSAFQTALRQLD